MWNGHGLTISPSSSTGCDTYAQYLLFPHLAGTVDQNQFQALRSKTLRLGFQEKMMEAFSTHPNMLKQIKHLSSLGY